jgi:hypothetical protein
MSSIDTMTISVFADNISGIFSDALSNEEHWLGSLYFTTPLNLFFRQKRKTK